MDEIAELVGVTPAEVGAPRPSTTCSTPSRLARYVVTVCTNIACMLAGAYELLEHAEEPSGVARRGDDRRRRCSPSRRPSAWPTVTAPCVQVNHRFFGTSTAALRPAGRGAARRRARPMTSRRTARWCGSGRASGCRPTEAVGGERADDGRRPSAPRRDRAPNEPTASLMRSPTPPIVTPRLGTTTRTRSSATSPTGGYTGCARRSHDARGGRRRGRRGEPARSRRRRFPGRPQVVDAAQGAASTYLVDQR